MSGMIACIAVVIVAILVGTFITVVANNHIKNFREDRFVHFVEQKVNGMNGNGR